MLQVLVYLRYLYLKFKKYLLLSLNLVGDIDELKIEAPLLLYLLTKYLPFASRLTFKNSLFLDFLIQNMIVSRVKGELL